MNRVLFAIFFIFIFVVFSCKKESTNNGFTQPQTLSAGTMRITVYGKSYNLFIDKVALNASQSKNSIKIIGKSIDGNKTITLVFNNISFLYPQNYSMSVIDAGSQSYISASYNISGDSVVYVCDGSKSKGKIGLTTLSGTTIRGFFDFQGVNAVDTSKKVTITGDFNALYTTNVVADVSTIRVNYNSTTEVMNVVSGYFINNGSNVSFIVEGKTSDSRDYVIIVVKDILSTNAQNYNCQSGPVVVSVTLYNGAKNIRYRCDGTQSPGNVMINGLSSTNTLGSFSVSGVNIDNIADKLTVTGEFNANLKSSSIVGADSVRTVFNGVANGMKIINAVNYISPNKQSVEIDATDKNNNSLSFYLQRVSTFTTDVYEFDIFNSTSSSYILASYTVNGLPFPMLSKIGQTVIYNTTNSNFSGAFSFDCPDNSDSSVVYTVNSDFNANIKSYTLTQSGVFEVVNDTTTNYIATAATDTTTNTFVISGADVKGKTVASISFTNLVPSEDEYQMGALSLDKRYSISFTFWVGSKKYVCDGKITNGMVRIESFSGTQITGFYSVDAYNVSNHSELIHLRGSFNSSIQ